MRMKLTQASVAALAPADLICWDTELPGFAVRVSVTGRKTWIVYYRVNGQQRKPKLGTFATIRADEARKQAKALLGDAAKGIDHQQVKIDARKAAEGRERAGAEYNRQTC
jgi:hypothetical protein